jgi:hypothetical protein
MFNRGFEEDKRSEFNWGPPTIAFPQESGILRNGGIRFEERFAFGLMIYD